MRSIFHWFVIALSIAIPLAGWPQARLLPIDEAASVPDFFSFRARLQAAVARRDAEAITAALSPNVKLSFGGDGGVAEFAPMWRPNEPDSPLWETLASVLALGGTFAPDGAFTAPYVFTRWPSDRDAFSHMVAVGDDVLVRAAPSASAEIIGALDFAIVEIGRDADWDSEWMQVNWPPGRTGFVARRLLRSPIDYRMSFAKLDGRWQIVFFVAGD